MSNRSLVLHATLFYATLPPWINCGTIQAGWFCFSRLLLILTGTVLYIWTLLCSNDLTLYFNILYSPLLYMLKPFAWMKTCFFYCWLCTHQGIVSIKVGSTSNLCEFLTFVWQWLKCVGGVGMNLIKLESSEEIFSILFLWRLAGCAHFALPCAHMVWANGNNWQGITWVTAALLLREM